jgi:hypothetical protein
MEEGAFGPLLRVRVPKRVEHRNRDAPNWRFRDFETREFTLYGRVH